MFVSLFLFFKECFLPKKAGILNRNAGLFG